MLSKGLPCVELDRMARGEDVFAVDPDAVERLLALAIAALRTWARVGLIPQAKHGGKGV